MASSKKLESASEKLRARQIGWEGYSRAGDVPQQDLQRIYKLAKQPKPVIDKALSEDIDGYAALFVRLLTSISRTDALQWSLVMLGDIIIGKDESRAQSVLRANPWDGLLRQLESQDEFCQLKAATLASLLLPSGSSVSSKVTPRLLKILGSQLRSTPENQDIALQCLGELLRIHEVRISLWVAETNQKGKGQAGSDAGAGKIIAGLVDLLKQMSESSTSTSAQLQYQVGLCFWLFSFEQEIDERIEAEFGVIPLLSGVAKRAAKEKVVRVILAAFRNMLTLAPNANKPAMLMASTGLLNFTQSLITSKRFFGDEEVKEDTEWLSDYLKAASRELTTWDEYVAEVESKQLSWSPAHTDNDFWLENAARVAKEDNGAVLKQLVALLAPSSSPLTLSVVCSDLGMFIKYYEFAKRDIQKLGAKAKVLELLQHSDPDVRYKALVIVQQLVSQSWNVGL